MTERTEMILYLCFATFAIVVLIAAILISRGGRTPETSALIKSMEAMRAQNSAEHGALQSDLRTSKGWLLRIMNRFGFLAQKDIDPPPAARKDDLQ